jgi:hypothetical protein
MEEARLVTQMQVKITRQGIVFTNIQVKIIW